ncbi:MAG TPA: hypothetical protein DCY88_30040 [Cyanobacteria bacterium UBA11372]|nr:hypothetical protein [Cyanobacteria bacterium UBA11372]
MDKSTHWQKVGELLRGATEAAEQLAIAERNYQSLLEALNRINFIQPAKETDKPPSDRHTEQTVSDRQELLMQVEKLSQELEKNKLTTEGLATDVQKLREPIGEIESIKRQVQALSYSLGILLEEKSQPNKASAAPVGSARKVDSTKDARAMLDDSAGTCKAENCRTCSDERAILPSSNRQRTGFT